MWAGILGRGKHTDFDPDEELAGSGAIFPSDVALDDKRRSQDDGNSKDQRQRGYIDHVPCYDAEVENLHVELAHSIEGSLVLPIA